MAASGRGLPRVSVDDVYLAPVHINVGGTAYTTTLQTLTSYPDSKIAKLFNGTLPITVDSTNNHYFLDANGSVFGHILDFLRYKELVLPEDFNQLQLLKKQAEFFEIEDMLKKLENLTDNEQGNQEQSELFEEGHGTGLQTRHKHRHRSKRNNNTVCHTSEEERVEEKGTGEGGENRVAVKDVRERDDVTETVDRASLMEEKTDVVIVRSTYYNSINIYSLGKVTLEEPIPGLSTISSQPSSFGTHFHSNTDGTHFELYMLHFVNQLQNKGYHLAFVNSTNSNTGTPALHEFVLYQGKL